MDIKDILFSKSHLIAPFTVTEKKRNKTAQFSTIEKVVSIAVSLLIGAFTGGILGVVAFYLITAAIKEKKLNNKHPTSEIIPCIFKKKILFTSK